MMDTGRRNRRRKLLLRGLGWGACVAVWTVALLTTYPAHVGKEVLTESVEFPAAKILHFCVYAFLTVWLSWLPSRPWRWGLLVVLSLHACGTEILQQFVPERTGTVRDAILDHVGMLVGMALTWKRWLPHF